MDQTLFITKGEKIAKVEDLFNANDIGFSASQYQNIVMIHKEYLGKAEELLNIHHIEYQVNIIKGGDK